MRRFWIFFLIAIAMFAGVTLLSGFALPLVLHQALMTVGLDRWVGWGPDYGAGVAYVTVSPEEIRQEGSWHKLARGAWLQLSAIPLFAVFSILPAIGVTLWITIRRRIAPHWLTGVLGGLPGFGLVAAFAFINWRGFFPISAEQEHEALSETLHQALMTLIWSQFVSWSLLVAVSAAICARVVNRWMPRP